MRRREFLRTAVAGVAFGSTSFAAQPAAGRRKSQIAITLDLEMSRHYPNRGMTEWDYKKGDLDEATKRYAVEEARVARQQGGLIHFFCVGRVLEHAPEPDWQGAPYTGESHKRKT